MNKNILEKLGLTNNEISVYLALLELGENTTGSIVRKAGIHTSRVYESLNQLIKKGLVSSIVKGKKKYFAAADPDTLMDVLEEEKRELNELLPQLKLMSKNKVSEEAATVYEGYKGVISVYDRVLGTLKKGDEISVFGARGADENFMAKTYFLQYTKRRVEKGIKMKMLFNEDAAETGKYYSKLPFTEVRYMAKGMKTPAAVDIYGDKVGILVLKEKPFVFLISSKEVADSYREFFRMMWGIAKK
jgi:sugar-specific transcriptional regulator TrmB